MKSYKLIGIALVLVSGLAFGIRSCYSQIAGGIPANIEPERVRPMAKVDLPILEISPDYVEYFLEPTASDIKLGDNYLLVHLRIPKKPHFPKSTTSGPIRTYGQTLDMIWPDLAGLGEPGGAACLEKYRNGPGGHCQNLVRVYIDFRNSRPQTVEQDEIANLEHHLQQSWVYPAKEKSTISELEIIAVDRKNASDEYRRLHFINRDASDKPTFTLMCKPYTPSPSCETRFSSNKSSNISIKVLFVHSLLPQWRQIVDAVQAKVGSYIIQTYSIPTKE
jgi:hypothetical protein